MVVAGPNGQGVISTAESMCAQIVAPIRRRAGSGWRARAGTSCRASSTTPASPGSACRRRSRRATRPSSAWRTTSSTSRPIRRRRGARLSRGRARRAPAAPGARALHGAQAPRAREGRAAAEGQRAAASHTGSLASDDRVFDGLCRQVGALRAPSVEHAFEWAASFATQPLPRGRRTVVFTTAGGWGVLAADACASRPRADPAARDLRRAIDGLVPPRWSRSNPVDLAGGETRDTIPEVLDLICAIPRSTASSTSPRHPGRPGPGLPLGPSSPATASSASSSSTSARTGATPARRGGLGAPRQARALRHRAHLHRPRLRQPGPVGVREEGRLCYPSAHRAVAPSARCAPTRTTGRRGRGRCTPPGPGGSACAGGSIPRC